MGINHSRQNASPSVRKESLRTNTQSSSVSNSTTSVMIEGRQYHKSDTATYCLPSDEVEQDRLNSVRFTMGPFFFLFFLFLLIPRCSNIFL